MVKVGDTIELGENVQEKMVDKFIIQENQQYKQAWATTKVENDRVFEKRRV